MEVCVTQAVADGLEAIRAGGEVNMFDRNSVAVLLSRADYHEATIWVNDNPKTYGNLIMRGLEVADVSDTDS